MAALLLKQPTQGARYDNVTKWIRATLNGANHSFKHGWKHESHQVPYQLTAFVDLLSPCWFHLVTVVTLCLERVVRSWVKLISDQFSFRFLILTVRSVDPLCYVLSVASFVLHIMIVLWCIFHFSVHSKKTPFRQWSCVTTSPCSASTKRRSSSSFTFPSHPTSSGLLLTPRSKDTERWGNHPFCSFSPLSLREVKSVFKLASDERTNNDGWDHRRNNLPHGASELVHSSHE